MCPAAAITCVLLYILASVGVVTGTAGTVGVVTMGVVVEGMFIVGFKVGVSVLGMSVAGMSVSSTFVTGTKVEGAAGFVDVSTTSSAVSMASVSTETVVAGRAKKEK